MGSVSFPDESFSKAYTINTVYFWNDLNKTMREIRRVLRLNGVFINTFYTNEMLSRFSHTQFGYMRYAAKDLLDAGQSAGLVVKAVPILQGTAICYIYSKKMDEAI